MLEVSVGFTASDRLGGKERWSEGAGWVGVLITVYWANTFIAVVLIGQHTNGQGSEVFFYRRCYFVSIVTVAVIEKIAGALVRTYFDQLRSRASGDFILCRNTCTCSRARKF